MTISETQAQADAIWQALGPHEKPRILVGTAACGRAAGAMATLEAIEKELERLNIDAELSQVGCIGLCYAEPLVDIAKPGRPRICYTGVTAELAPKLIEDYLLNDNPHPDLALGTIGEGSIADIGRLFEQPPLAKQRRLTLRHCGLINPEEIDDYIAVGGYKSIQKALKMAPQQVIDEIKGAGLRGRGGAGFSTGQKWQLCRDAVGDAKYIICNADEGDPGAFMDRSIMEGDPHAVLEGLAIGAYAMGASQGYIYIRTEYPLAVKRVRRAVKQAEESGFLGSNILGSGFSFKLKVKEGAGAFVCGEETALMASIEGKRGMPRPRPPFPAQSGLWGKPTNINNVKTLAAVPVVMEKGAAWYSKIGSEKSPGTAIFALTGKIAKSGLVEVPMGTPLHEVIWGIGGGLQGGKSFKAVQTGGPSGGCLPATLFNVSLDYESLAAVGSFMGSGGMVVMDEDTCMVDIARFFLSFTQSESCGKCVPCRLGTKQMLGILEKICAGKGQPEDIELLKDMAASIKAGSLCGLGQSAPNPVLTTIRYFLNEYEEHIYDKRCRAASCKGLAKAPCSHTCPAGIDVPRYIRAIRRGQPSEALAVIRERIPFPSVCGLVCFHPCEAKCRRAQLDDAVAIRELKRYAAEAGGDSWKQLAVTKPATGKKVAIVGSGPAGLTCAYYLARLGHQVTVFEALPEPGGMMAVAIPDYRLPKDILKTEIKEITDLGVEIRTNTEVHAYEELFSQGYEAIFIAIGHHKGITPGIEGEESPHFQDSLTFLREVHLGHEVKIGKRVAVIGGGNTAIDSARAARRLGAEKVVVIYRRTMEEMPASFEEVEEMLAEGVELLELTMPTRITHEDEHVTLELRQMKPGAVEASGRRRPEPVAGTEFIMKFDNVLAAIGQRLGVSDQFDVPTGPKDTIMVNPRTLATPKEGIFAGGDAVTGPASVIEAIAQGRLAARSIDKYLGGSGDISEVLAPPETEIPPLKEGEARRPVTPTMPVVQRLKGFPQVELGYDEETAIREAGRCLHCDLENSEC